MKEAIVLTTKGRAAEYQGKYFGIYVPIVPSDSKLAYTAFRQMETHGNSTAKYIFREYAPSGAWYVGDRVGDTSSAIMFNSDMNTSIPSSGWEYYVPENGSLPENEKWYYDCEMRAMKLSEIDSWDLPCEKVKIESKKVIVNIVYLKNKYKILFYQKC